MIRHEFRKIRHVFPEIRHDFQKILHEFREILMEYFSKLVELLFQDGRSGQRANIHRFTIHSFFSSPHPQI